MHKIASLKHKKLLALPWVYIQVGDGLYQVLFLSRAFYWCMLFKGDSCVINQSINQSTTFCKNLLRCWNLMHEPKWYLQWVNPMAYSVALQILTRRQTDAWNSYTHGGTTVIASGRNVTLRSQGTHASCYSTSPPLRGSSCAHGFD